MKCMVNGNVLLLARRDKHVDLVVLEYNVVALNQVVCDHALRVLLVGEGEGLVAVEHTMARRRDGGTGADGSVAVKKQIGARLQHSLRTAEARHYVEVTRRSVKPAEDVEAGIEKNYELVRRRHITLALIEPGNQVSISRFSTH